MLAVVEAANASSVVEQMGSAERLGIVAILMLAVVALYRDSKKREEEFKGLVVEMTRALTEVRDEMRKCEGRKER